MSGYATTQPNDRRFIRGTARSWIVSELTTTRPEPRFQLDVRDADGAAVCGDFHSLFILNVAVGWLSLAHFPTDTHVTAFPPGFSQAFRS
jgi:hypothetical protein